MVVFFVTIVIVLECIYNLQRDDSHLCRDYCASLVKHFKVTMLIKDPFVLKASILKNLQRSQQMLLNSGSEMHNKGKYTSHDRIVVSILCYN